MNIEKFCKEIGENVERFELDKKTTIDLDEFQIDAIKEIITYFYKNYPEFGKKLFLDIIKQPNSSNGKIYEALVYYMLYYNKIEFILQPKIKSKDCLKNNDYYADGKIGNMIFDIKKFGFTPIDMLIDEIQKKLDKKYPGKYYITYDGNKNSNVKDIDKFGFRHLGTIIDNLTNKESLMHEIPELNLKIKANLLSSNKEIYVSYTYSEKYKFAKNNEFYPMYHASQFCIYNPYILIYTLDSYNANTLVKSNASEIGDFLYPLCRRIFINLKNKNEIKIRRLRQKSKKTYNYIRSI